MNTLFSENDVAARNEIIARKDLLMIDKKKTEEEERFVACADWLLSNERKIRGAFRAGQQFLDLEKTPCNTKMEKATVEKLRRVFGKDRMIDFRPSFDVDGDDGGSHTFSADIWFGL